MSAIPRAEPPRWLWLWFPLLILALERAAFIRDYTWYDTVYTEHGFVEILTAVAAAAGVATGLAVLRHRSRLPTKALRIWVVLVTLGCFYAAGEETSWLQDVFHWETPAEWAAINHYGETNISGLDPRFEEAPRNVVWLFVVAGIVHMLLQRGASWFWPTYVCLPSALLAVLMRVPETLQRIGVDPVIYYSNWDETEELFLAWFLFLYLLSIWYRLAEAQGQGPAGREAQRIRRGQGQEVLPVSLVPPRRPQSVGADEAAQSSVARRLRAGARRLTLRVGNTRARARRRGADTALMKRMISEICEPTRDNSLPYQPRLDSGRVLSV